MVFEAQATNDIHISFNKDTSRVEGRDGLADQSPNYEIVLGGSPALRPFPLPAMLSSLSSSGQRVLQGMTASLYEMFTSIHPSIRPPTHPPTHPHDAPIRVDEPKVRLEEARATAGVCPEGGQPRRCDHFTPLQPLLDHPGQRYAPPRGLHVWLVLLVLH